MKYLKVEQAVLGEEKKSDKFYHPYSVVSKFLTKVCSRQVDVWAGHVNFGEAMTCIAMYDYPKTFTP